MVSVLMRTADNVGLQAMRQQKSWNTTVFIRIENDRRAVSLYLKNSYDHKK